ncbi:MAG: hypothetical protein AB1Z31_19635, partial [Desulfobacterales bacterium]
NYKHHLILKLGQINLTSQYPIIETRFQFPAGVAFKYWIYNKVASFKAKTTAGPPTGGGG